MEAERERLLGLSEDFYDREDYTLFCVGHMEDRYVMRFINPTGEMVMQKIERMTGGYQDSTAILEYRDDGSYFQIGGTPGGYTAEILSLIHI